MMWVTPMSWSSTTTAMHIGRRAVRAQDDEVVEVFGLEHHLALHMVLDDGSRRIAVP
jgi:hypothetical protein